MIASEQRPWKKTKTNKKDSPERAKDDRTTDNRNQQKEKALKGRKMIASGQRPWKKTKTNKKDSPERAKDDSIT